MTPKITSAGEDLMLMALDGVGLTFTKMVLGSGDAPDDYKSLTDLVNPVVGAEIGLDDIAIEENYALIKGTLDNTALSGSFSWTEIGIFCKNPNDSEGDDILYAYGHYKLSDDEDEVESAVPVTKYSNNVVTLTINVYVYVGDVENVAAVLAESAEYATKDELNAHAQDTDNPHKVTAYQVGLENVPNVATNDQTPTYTTASTLTSLVSGEKLSTAFGKIAKAVSSLISHINNKSNPHGVTASQISAAAASHSHSAADITSGTLGLARGGTGGTTAEAAVNNLAGLNCGTVTTRKISATNQNLNSYTTGGVYWVQNSAAGTMSNAPYTATNYLLIVMAPSSSFRLQFIVPIAFNDYTYMRAYHTSDGWGAWRRFTGEKV